jgi:hypothetical protein
MSFDLPKTRREAVASGELLAAAIDACNEAWNAFDNGKRKHHRDALTGKCILGCQACAIEKLKLVLAANDPDQRPGESPKTL